MAKEQNLTWAPFKVAKQVNSAMKVGHGGWGHELAKLLHSEGDVWLCEGEVLELQHNSTV